MTRSKTQVLFGYLPGQVFEHENGVIAKTVHVRERRAEVNEELMLEGLADELDRWRNRDGQSRAAGFPDPSNHRDRYVGLEPDGEVYYDVWPLLLRCTRSTCGKVAEFRRVEDWRRAARPAVCDICGGRREQMPYVMVHSCGRIKSLSVAPCPRHALQQIYLEDTGSFETSQWRCRAGGCNGRSISGMRYDACGCGESGPFVSMTIRQNGRFLTQTFPFVSFDPGALARLRDQPGAGKVVVGSYLGLFDDYQAALDDLRRGGGGSVENWKLFEQALKHGGRSPEEIEVERRRHFGVADAAFHDLLELVPEEVIERIGIGQKARERTLIFGGAGNLRLWRLEKFRREALANGRHGAVERLDGAGQKLRDAGFADAFVVENFPVALVAYGFTRLSSDPNEVLLKPFPEMHRHRGKTPLYATKSLTEAIFFELDALRVAEWLVENEIITRPTLGDGADPLVAAKTELLMQYDASEDVKRALVVLQHTLAHALIRNLGERAGFGEETMAEYLIPSMLTFGIYANVHQEFTLGALVSLMEHRLGAWLDATREGARTCAWDPVCGEHEGACASCLHLAFGCNISLDPSGDGERPRIPRNHLLDRGVLFGSPPDHLPVIHRGFWE